MQMYKSPKKEEVKCGQQKDQIGTEMQMYKIPKKEEVKQEIK